MSPAPPPASAAQQPALPGIAPVMLDLVAAAAPSTPPAEHAATVAAPKISYPLGDLEDCAAVNAQLPLQAPLRYASGGGSPGSDPVAGGATPSHALTMVQVDSDPRSISWLPSQRYLNRSMTAGHRVT